eukprot:scaffold93329_cov32-Tisochrysis_lutea.AAC.3
MPLSAHALLLCRGSCSHWLPSHFVADRSPALLHLQRSGATDVLPHAGDQREGGPAGGNPQRCDRWPVHHFRAHS